MEASAKTIEVCTTDAYTDNYRERRQYAQTGYYAALGNYWLFGDHALQRRYLVQVAQEQEANGVMPAAMPPVRSGAPGRGFGRHFSRLASLPYSKLE